MHMSNRNSNPDDSRLHFGLSAVWNDLDGPEGGDITAVFVHPRHKDQLWAGSGSGAIFHKSGADSDWIRCKTPLIKRGSVLDFCLISGYSPALLAAFYPNTIIGTPDQGVFWRDYSGNLDTCTIHSITDHPLHPGMIVVCTSEGLFYSLTQGKHWRLFPGTEEISDVTAVCFHPDDPRIFWIAGTTSNRPSIRLTVDGGQNFFYCLQPENGFSSITSLVLNPQTGHLWAAGVGKPRIIRSHMRNPATWETVDPDVPDAVVTKLCMQPKAGIRIGISGHGLFAFDETSSKWQCMDCAGEYREVRCLAASEEAVYPATKDLGVARFTDNFGQLFSKGLTACNVKRIHILNGELTAWIDSGIQVRKDSWSKISGFKRIARMESSRRFLWVLETTGSVFRYSAETNAWEKVFHSEVPVNSICVSIDETAFLLFHSELLHNMTIVQELTGEWTAQTVQPPDSRRIRDCVFWETDSASYILCCGESGLYAWNTQTGSWSGSKISRNSGGAIQCLVKSPVLPNRIYCSLGERILYSDNMGTSFDHDAGVVFPSEVTTIKLLGDTLETILVGTAGGGVYTSFFPGQWNALVSDEAGIRINDIASDLDKHGCLFPASKGASVAQVCIPWLKLRSRSVPEDSFGMHRLFLTMNNPGIPFPVDFHLMQLLSDDRTAYHLVGGQATIRSNTPAPFNFVLPGQTALPEIFLGSIEITEPSMLVAGLFKPGTWIPLAQPSVIRVDPGKQNRSGRHSNNLAT